MTHTPIGRLVSFLILSHPCLSCCVACDGSRKATVTTSVGPVGNRSSTVITRSDRTPRGVGINFFVNTDWDFGYIFADVVKQGRYWTPIVGWPKRAAVDANGWPTGDAEMILVTKESNGYDASGTYKLSCEVSTPKITIEAREQAPAGSVTINNQVYKAGVLTADVTMSPQARQLWIAFHNTSNGVRNVQIFRPGHKSGDVFARDMLNAIDMFSTIRPMQLVGEPNNKAVNWTSRRLPKWPQQSNDDELGYGVAYEYLVMLANQANKDLWLCVPRLADDDYLTKLAELVRYGSNGVNPYTSVQPKPVWPPLDANLNLYVEFSNEVWNYHIDDERRLAADEVTAGDHNHYDFDGTPGLDKSAKVNRWAYRRTGFKGMHISNLFRQVFGDAQMPGTGNSRIRPVIAGLFDYSEVYLQPLKYVNEVFGPGNTKGNAPHPVSYYFYALSGAPYVTLSAEDNNSDSLTIDKIFDGLNNNLKGNGADGKGSTVFRAIDEMKSHASHYGLKLVAYEGGQALYRNGHSNEAKAQAQHDPRMRQITKDLLTKWYSVTDGAFVYFTIGRSGDFFALGNGYSDVHSPKWQALKEVSAGN